MVRIETWSSMIIFFSFLLFSFWNFFLIFNYVWRRICFIEFWEKNCKVQSLHYNGWLWVTKSNIVFYISLNLEDSSLSLKLVLKFPQKERVREANFASTARIFFWLGLEGGIWLGLSFVSNVCPRFFFPLNILNRVL